MKKIFCMVAVISCFHMACAEISFEQTSPVKKTKQIHTGSINGDITSGSGDDTLGPTPNSDSSASGNITSGNQDGTNSSGSTSADTTMGSGTDTITNPGDIRDDKKEEKKDE